jgi:primosomal protein N' (replication factor Y)
MGSERVEEVARERFPKARVARIDLETLRTSGEERAVEQLLRGEFDILVATPMIAKGQALPRVGLVAAVGIDALLALPDFRAAEWTYQYLVGLAGRVADGEAMVETHYPEHYAIQAAARGDYEGFYRRECAERRALSYPPFSHLARLVLLAKSDPTGKRISAALAAFDVEGLGPSPLASRAGHAKVLLKGRDEETVRAACLAVRKELAKVEVDLDPARL